jgi:hypothetical protein
MYLLFSLFLLLFCWTPINAQQNPFKFGAIFLRHEDAHLYAAFNYSINWINTNLHLPLSYSGGRQFEQAVEVLFELGDHYGLLNKGKFNRPLILDHF